MNTKNCSQDTSIKTKYNRYHGDHLMNENTIYIGLLFNSYYGYCCCCSIHYHFKINILL